MDISVESVDFIMDDIEQYKSNLSQLEVYVRDYYHGSSVYYQIMTGIMALTVALNVLFNGTILIVVLYSRVFRSTANIYICSLSVSDLTFSIYIIYAIVSELTSISLEDNFHIKSCFVKFYLLYVVALSSIWAMVAVAVDRYRSIVSPHKRKFTPKQCLIILLFVWVFSIGVAALPVSSYTSRQYRVDINGSIYNLHPVLCDSPEIYGYIIESLVSYIIPLTTITILYTHIIKVLRRPTSVKSESSLKAKMTAVKMMGMIVVCFSICWLPQCICLSYYFWSFGFKSITNRTLSFAEFKHLLKWYDAFLGSMIAISCYSWLNATIYIYFSSQFRQAIKTMFTCRKNNIINDDEVTQASGMSSMKIVNGKKVIVNNKSDSDN